MSDTIGIDVVDLVYKSFLKANPPRARKLRHYPSSLSMINEAGEFSGKCRRAGYWSMVGVEPTNPIDPPALFKMNVGDAIHDLVDKRLEDAMRDNGYQVEYQANEEAYIWEVEGLALPMSGRVDKVIVIDGRKLLGEWKSTFGRGVVDVKNNGPKEDALMQVVAYLNSPEIEADGAMLVYIGRDNGLMHGFYVTIKDDQTVRLETMGAGVISEIKMGMADIVRALQPLERALMSVNEDLDAKVEIDDKIAHILEMDDDEDTQIELQDLENQRDQYVMSMSTKAPDRDYEGFVNEKLGKLMGKSHWRCRYCSYRGLCYGVSE